MPYREKLFECGAGDLSCLFEWNTCVRTGVLISLIFPENFTFFFVATVSEIYVLSLITMTATSYKFNARSNESRASNAPESRH